MRYLPIFLIILLSSCSTSKQTNLKPSLKEEINISIIDSFGDKDVYLVK